MQAFLNIGSRGDGLCEPSLERYDKFDGSWLDMHSVGFVIMSLARENNLMYPYAVIIESEVSHACIH